MNKYFNFENPISTLNLKDTSKTNSPKHGAKPTASNPSGISLGNQLLLTVLPIVLMPLIINQATNYVKKMQLQGSQRIQVIDGSTGRVITTAKITNMLNSVEDMSPSRKEVAEKSKTSVQMEHRASATVKTAGQNLHQTVATIYQLPFTIAATVKKVKHLGKLSQEIVQAMVPIHQIAMKTNILELNANIKTTKIKTNQNGLDTTVAQKVADLDETYSYVRK